MSKLAKRLIIFFLVASMALVLVACGNTNDNAQQSRPPFIGDDWSGPPWWVLPPILLPPTNNSPLDNFIDALFESDNWVVLLDDEYWNDVTQIYTERNENVMFQFMTDEFINTTVVTFSQYLGDGLATSYRAQWTFDPIEFWSYMGKSWTATPFGNINMNNANREMFNAMGLTGRLEDLIKYDMDYVLDGNVLTFNFGQLYYTVKIGYSTVVVPSYVSANATHVIPSVTGTWIHIDGTTEVFLTYNSNFTLEWHVYENGVLVESFFGQWQIASPGVFYDFFLTIDGEEEDFWADFSSIGPSLFVSNGPFPNKTFVPFP